MNVYENGQLIIGNASTLYFNRGDDYFSDPILGSVEIEAGEGTIMSRAVVHTPQLETSRIKVGNNTGWSGTVTINGNTLTFTGGILTAASGSGVTAAS